MPDGKSIISGWSDGRIRAYGPQSGKLLFTILDAHVFVSFDQTKSKASYNVYNDYRIQDIKSVDVTS